MATKGERMNDDLKTWPQLSPVLNKALIDHFSYAVKLRTGEVLTFSEASYGGGEWIHLQEPDTHVVGGISVNTARGVDVRLSDIVWAVDAPGGS